MAVLDSSFLIAMERGTPSALRLLREMTARRESVRVPAAAWVEFLSSFPPSTRARAARVLEESCLFEPFGRDVADVAARLQHELARDGRRLGWHDLQIAATALALGESVVTSDLGFRAVPGLDVVPH